MNIINCKETANNILSNIKPNSNKLVIAQLGNNPDDNFYIKSITSKLEYCTILKLPLDIKASDFYSKLNNIQPDTSILVLQPLPTHISKEVVSNIIDANQDIDGISVYNLGSLITGTKCTKAPCTTLAVLEILKQTGVLLKGKKVVILGRSSTVTLPLAVILTKLDATVTVCHSKTENLLDITQTADILITAIGKPRFVTDAYIKEGAIVIDVGINTDTDGKLCGDTNITSKASMITSVPNGVGLVTTAILRHK